MGMLIDDGAKNCVIFVTVQYEYNLKVPKRIIMSHVSSTAASLVCTQLWD